MGHAHALQQGDPTRCGQVPSSGKQNFHRTPLLRRRPSWQHYRSSGALPGLNKWGTAQTGMAATTTAGQRQHPAAPKAHMRMAATTRNAASPGTWRHSRLAALA